MSVNAAIPRTIIRILHVAECQTHRLGMIKEGHVRIFRRNKVKLKKKTLKIQNGREQSGEGAEKLYREQKRKTL